MALDFSKLYVFSQAGRRGAFSAECTALEPAAALLAHLRRLFHGQDSASEPVPFHWAEGLELHDALLSTIPSYLLSNRIFNALEAAQATGWSRFPVTLSAANGKRIDGYSGLVVTGKCGSLQYDRSSVETRVGASGAKYDVKIGLCFDEASWDGSDVFTAEASTFVFMTERAKQAIVAAKATNVSFTAMSKFERQW